MIDRFYTEHAFDEAPILTGPEFHHLKHVLRVRTGEEIDLVNGRGTLARARVEKIEKESAHLVILHQSQHPKPTPSCRLGLALIRMERLEWAIEKGTELGAEAFYLFPADGSEKKQLTEHQLSRLRLIAIAALKQCNRLYLPEIQIVQSMEETIPSDAEFFFGDVSPDAPWLTPFLTHQQSLFFISGPEKGFSQREEDWLKRHGRGIKLHENILRAETAPLVALSLMSQKRSV
jgi:16S rRNA (uracil1498-N3)-methyltransferase